jgi:hypothetical protein
MFKPMTTWNVNKPSISLKKNSIVDTEKLYDNRRRRRNVFGTISHVYIRPSEKIMHIKGWINYKTGKEEICSKTRGEGRFEL